MAVAHDWIDCPAAARGDGGRRTGENEVTKGDRLPKPRVFLPSARTSTSAMRLMHQMRPLLWPSAISIRRDAYHPSPAPALLDVVSFAPLPLILGERLAVAASCESAILRRSSPRPTAQLQHGRQRHPRLSWLHRSVFMLL